MKLFWCHCTCPTNKLDVTILAESHTWDEAVAFSRSACISQMRVAPCRVEGIEIAPLSLRAQMLPHNAILIGDLTSIAPIPSTMTPQHSDPTVN